MAMENSQAIQRGNLETYLNSFNEFKIHTSKEQVEFLQKKLEEIKKEELIFSFKGYSYIKDNLVEELEKEIEARVEDSIKIESLEPDDLFKNVNNYLNSSVSAFDKLVELIDLYKDNTPLEISNKMDNYSADEVKAAIDRSLRSVEHANHWNELVVSIIEKTKNDYPDKISPQLLKTVLELNGFDEARIEALINVDLENTDYWNKTVLIMANDLFKQMEQTSKNPKSIEDAKREAALLLEVSGTEYSPIEIQKYLIFRGYSELIVSKTINGLLIDSSKKEYWNSVALKKANQYLENNIPLDMIFSILENDKFPRESIYYVKEQLKNKNSANSKYDSIESAFDALIYNKVFNPNEAKMMLLNEGYVATEIDELISNSKYSQYWLSQALDLSFCLLNRFSECTTDEILDMVRTEGFNMSEILWATKNTIGLAKRTLEKAIEVLHDNPNYEWTEIKNVITENTSISDQILEYVKGQIAFIKNNTKSKNNPVLSLRDYHEKYELLDKSFFEVDWEYYHNSGLNYNEKNNYLESILQQFDYNKFVKFPDSIKYCYLEKMIQPLYEFGKPHIIINGKKHKINSFRNMVEGVLKELKEKLYSKGHYIVNDKDLLAAIDIMEINASISKKAYKNLFDSEVYEKLDTEMKIKYLEMLLEDIEKICEDDLEASDVYASDKAHYNALLVNLREELSEERNDLFKAIDTDFIKDYLNRTGETNDLKDVKQMLAKLLERQTLTEEFFGIDFEELEKLRERVEYNNRLEALYVARAQGKPDNELVMVGLLNGTREKILKIDLEKFIKFKEQAKADEISLKELQNGYNYFNSDNLLEEDVEREKNNIFNEIKFIKENCGSKEEIISKLKYLLNRYLELDKKAKFKSVKNLKSFLKKCGLSSKDAKYYSEILFDVEDFIKSKDKTDEEKKGILNNLASLFKKNEDKEKKDSLYRKIKNALQKLPKHKKNVKKVKNKKKAKNKNKIVQTLKDNVNIIIDASVLERLENEEKNVSIILKSLDKESESSSLIGGVYLETFSDETLNDEFSIEEIDSNEYYELDGEMTHLDSNSIDYNLQKYCLEFEGWKIVTDDEKIKEYKRRYLNEANRTF